MIDSSVKEVTGVTTRLDQTSPPWEFVSNYPTIYGDTNVSEETTEDMRYLCAYTQDDHLNRHISVGMTYPVSFFTSAIEVIELGVPIFEEQISSLEGVDQYSLFVEALTWFDFDLDEVSSMPF